MSKLVIYYYSHLGYSRDYEPFDIALSKGLTLEQALQNRVYEEGIEDNEYKDHYARKLSKNEIKSLFNVKNVEEDCDDYYNDCDDFDNDYNNYDDYDKGEDDYDDDDF